MLSAPARATLHAWKIFQLFWLLVAVVMYQVSKFIVLLNRPSPFFAQLPFGSLSVGYLAVLKKAAVLLQTSAGASRPNVRSTRREQLHALPAACAWRWRRQQGEGAVGFHIEREGGRAKTQRQYKSGGSATPLVAVRGAPDARHSKRRRAGRRYRRSAATDGLAAAAARRAAVGLHEPQRAPRRRKREPTKARQ